MNSAIKVRKNSLTSSGAISIMFIKSVKSQVIGFPLINDTDQSDGEADAELSIRNNTYEIGSRG